MGRHKLFWILSAAKPVMDECPELDWNTMVRVQGVGLAGWLECMGWVSDGMLG